MATKEYTPKNNRVNRGGLTRNFHVEYHSWFMLNGRCYKSKYPGYHRYGGRGITVCRRWRGRHGFEKFLEDLGPRPSCRHTIDRIDNDGNYCPKNCRWAIPVVQSRNRGNNRKITAFGENLCVSEWAERSGLGWNTIIYRIKRGWSPERAVTEKPANVGYRAKLNKEKNEPS